MGSFLHSVCVQEVAISADGVYNYDLPVNPLSVVLLCLRPLNETSTAANFKSYLGLVGALDRVSVYSRGASVISSNGSDLAAMNLFRRGVEPFQGNVAVTDNVRRCAVLPLFFGKEPYSPHSCLPASRRGELVLELNIDIADTGYDGMRLSVETIELPDAKPKEFERMVTQNQTMVVGENDIDLSPGLDVRGLLMWGTTGFSGATPAPTLGRLSVNVDNMPAGIVSSDFEVLQMLYGLYGRGLPQYDQRVAAGNDAYLLGNLWANWAFVDFDPTRDDQYTLKLQDASRFHVRSTAEAAEACRFTPVEVMRL